MGHFSALAAAADTGGLAVPAASVSDFFKFLFGGKTASSTSQTSSAVTSSGGSSAAGQAGGSFLQQNLLLIIIGVLVLAVILTGVILLIRFLGKKRAKKESAPEVTEIGQTEESPQNRNAVLVGNAQELGKRENQQDSFAVSDVNNEALCSAKGVFAVVADGMGGLSNGYEVSSLVVRSMLEYFEQCGGELSGAGLLQQMLADANDKVNAYLQQQGNLQSGSTVVAVILHERSLHWVTVGDSRLYLFRGNRLFLLNKPHNLGAQLDEQVLLGGMTKEEALSNPERHALTSYLGIGKLELVDSNIAPFALQPGDKIILCSDGVFGTVSEDEMIASLGLPPHQAAEEILHQVTLKGKKYQDNSTIVILECQ